MQDQKNNKLAWVWPTISLLLCYFSSTMIYTNRSIKSSNSGCRARLIKLMSSPETSHSHTPLTLARTLHRPPSGPTHPLHAHQIHRNPWWSYDLQLCSFLLPTASLLLMFLKNFSKRWSFSRQIFFIFAFLFYELSNLLLTFWSVKAT